MDVSPNAQHEANPGTPSTDTSAEPDAIQIQLTIEREAVVAYLRAIAPEKREIALLHALEVGVTELSARRERFAAGRSRH